jgi:hypothetical protein
VNVLLMLLRSYCFKNRSVSELQVCCVSGARGGNDVMSLSREGKRERLKKLAAWHQLQVIPPYTCCLTRSQVLSS